MKTIFLSFFILIGILAHSQTYTMVSMEFTTNCCSDTATSGLGITAGPSDNNSMKYKFTSNTPDQVSEIVCIDRDGGVLVSGDTLRCTLVSLTLDNNTFDLQVPVIAIVSTNGNIVTLTMQWCILPLNGVNVYNRTVFSVDE